MSWYVYILQCADDTLYTGIAKDLDRRVDEHNTSPLAAKYTRVRRPVSLVYSETYDTRSEATKREMQIKRMKRSAKQALIADMLRTD